MNRNREERQLFENLADEAARLLSSAKGNPKKRDFLRAARQALGGYRYSEDDLKTLADILRARAAAHRAAEARKKTLGIILVGRPEQYKLF